MRRIVVTGAGGFVAGSVLAQAGAEWEVHAFSGKEPLVARPGLIWHRLDLKQPVRAREAIDAIRPDVTIHAAAIGDIDFCELHPEIAHASNVDLTAAITDHCADRGCRLIFLSTDNVFDGARGNYVETDSPTPINEYARTKAAAESLVSQRVEQSVVVRSALVMGFGLVGTGNSFLERTLPKLRDGRTIYVPPEEIRTPIDVVTLGRALLELAAGDFRGTLHLAGNEALDRVALTRRIAKRFGFSADLVQPRSPIELAGRAPRPRDATLNNSAARSLLRTAMQDFDAAIDLIRAVSDRRR
jgi:dTDP-4-dehydrorhamnose reductase